VYAPLNGNLGACTTSPSTTFEATVAKNSKCQIACDAGFHASHSGAASDDVQRATCSSAGVLSTPICEKDPISAQSCTVTAAANGVLAADTDSFASNFCTASLQDGLTCYPKCDDGFHASGLTSCVNGVLTASTCESICSNGDSPCTSSTRVAANQCVVYAPVNGHLVNDDGTEDENINMSVLSNGETCAIGCDTGYHAADASNAASSSPVQCSENGQLSNVVICVEDPVSLVEKQAPKTLMRSQHH